MTSLLELESVTRVFGGLRAVDGVDLRIDAGARHGLIGPNGAGKSTLFKLILGVERVSSGRVHFDGRDITELAEHKRVRLGLAQTFQHSSVFGTLSCADNVRLALQRRTGEARRLVGRRSAGLGSPAAALLARVTTVRLGRYRRPFDPEREADWIVAAVDLAGVDVVLSGAKGWPAV